MIMVIATIITMNMMITIIIVMMVIIIVMMDDDFVKTMKMIPWLASAREGGNGSDEREAPRPARRQRLFCC